MLPTEEITRIFTLSPSKNFLRTRESDKVEFKQSFNPAGLSQYARDLAAFANNSGGFIIFGVKDSPHIPIGLQNNLFTATEDSKITEFINQHFAPEIKWSKATHEYDGKTFGIIYVHECKIKPVIAINDGGRAQEIRKGDIYYRYRAQTGRIHYSELQHIITGRIEKEREAWQRLFERIAKIGPENIAILDTLKGKIEGEDRTILIDDELVPKLKFIREGEFNEKKGATTLRLIGDVQPVGVVVVGVKEKILPQDIYIFRPKDVEEQVAKAINNIFRANPEHVKCWRYYSVRGTYDEGKAKCNPKYCEYKEALNYFMYTQDWVDFLIKELSDPDKYNKVISTKLRYR